MVQSSCGTSGIEADKAARAYYIEPEPDSDDDADEGPTDAALAALEAEPGEGEPDPMADTVVNPTAAAAG